METESYSASEDTQRAKLASYEKLLFAAIGTFLSGNLAVIGYIFALYHDLAIRTTAIESTRFTRQNAAEIRDLIARNSLALSKIPSEYPPKWFSEIVAENRAAIKELESRIRVLERRRGT